jgi:hypothetical protein
MTREYSTSSDSPFWSINVIANNKFRSIFQTISPAGELFLPRFRTDIAVTLWISMQCI